MIMFYKPRNINNMVQSKLSIKKTYLNRVIEKCYVIFFSFTECLCLKYFKETNMKKLSQIKYDSDLICQ